jgi:hypothetical protein
VRRKRGRRGIQRDFGDEMENGQCGEALLGIGWRLRRKVFDAVRAFRV